MNRTVKQLLGDRVLGMVDYCLHPAWKSSWGGALNGQRHRQRMVEALTRRLPLDAIVETGTYRGTTTSYLASLSSRPIYTVENDKRTRGFALLALRRFENVHQFGGDSRRFLRELASEPNLTSKTN
jgi:predicted O-methyltransferase YrrM